MSVKSLIESNLNSVEVRQLICNEGYSPNKWIALFNGVSVKSIKKSVNSIISSTDFKYLGINNISTIASILLKKSKPVSLNTSLILINFESAIVVGRNTNSKKIKTLKSNISLVSLTSSANVEFKLISPSQLTVYQIM